MAHRWGYQVWGKDAPRRFFNDKHWNEPLKWNKLAEQSGKRRRCFTGSMCDIMERREDYKEPRERLFRLIEQTNWLDWLLLTKRPQEFNKMLPKEWLEKPRKNVWLMTTVERQDYVWRVGEMMQAPAVVYGVSLEPLLGPVTLPDSFMNLGNRAWVIVGGETGANARGMNIDWVRQLRDDCLKFSVPFHLKQIGDIDFEGKRVGAKLAGRKLDGDEWDGVPESVW